MSSLALIRPTGMKQGDIVQLLYEIGYLLENDVNGEEASSTDFTITVKDRVGTSVVGAADHVKVLEANGFNWSYAIQYLYEIVVYMIASITNATEADFTGAIVDYDGTYSGGTTTRNYIINHQGLHQGDFCQMLYEVVECLIDDVTGPQASDFTLDVEDKSGNMAGVSG